LTVNIIDHSIVLEENRGVLEREIHHLRTLVKDADQQVARLTEDLNVNQQKLERSQDAQNRWKERSEALVEQLQAEQNRTILAEQAVTKYMNKAQAIKMHFQQVSNEFLMIFNVFSLNENFRFLNRWNSNILKNSSNLVRSIRYTNNDWMRWM
jgi:chromosome segregation ATPase